MYIEIVVCVLKQNMDCQNFVLYIKLKYYCIACLLGYLHFHYAVSFILTVCFVFMSKPCLVCFRRKKFVRESECQYWMYVSPACMTEESDSEQGEKIVTHQLLWRSECECILYSTTNSYNKY